MIDTIRMITGAQGSMDWVNGLVLVVLVIFSLNVVVELLVTVSSRLGGHE